jgi:ligand-binding sensor domain-containing protein/serine phosphatase RsbU (regulator of sigma subunit)
MPSYRGFSPRDSLVLLLAISGRSSLMSDAMQHGMMSGRLSFGSMSECRTMRSVFITAVVAVVSCYTASAQKKMLFEHLTVKEGLSQGSVTCILQDRQGFMWFGTQDGLNRYNGYTLKVFRHDPADPKSLSENFITSIIEDRNGALWVATVGREDALNRFEPLTETFARYPRDSVDLRGALEGSANSSYEEPSGVRWWGKIGGGVTRFDPKTGAKRSFKHDPSDSKSLIDNNVYSVYGDRSGTLWIGTREGLDRFDRETESFVHYRHDDANPMSLGSNWVWPIFEDRSGVLWVGTFGGGLNRFDRAAGTFTRFKHSETDPRSLADDQMYSISQDRSGIIWVGTADHGVDRFHPELGAFLHYSHDPANPASLVDNMIKAIHVDRAGVPWIGTTGGLDRFDRSKGTFTHFSHNALKPRSIIANVTQTIYEDRSGTLWIGMLSSGLERFDRRTGVFTHYRHDPTNPHSLSDNRVYALLEDHAGNLWVGNYGGGLNLLDRKSGKFTVYTHSDSIPGSLSARGVWALCEDHEGVLWVGTSGGGLNRFDREKGSFTHFKHSEADTKSLSDDLVLSILEDRSGTLWVGTLGGLNRLDRVRGTFKRYREKDGLANDLILGILEDGHGNLWISTNKGLSKFDPLHETFRNYGESDGLQGDEFNQNAYARSPVTGEMYFGGGNGFNVFHPDSVRGNPYVPPVVFSMFTRYNTDDKEGKPIAEKGIAARPEITLSYKDNVATFEFAALNYYSSSRNQYAYKLEGFSDNWIQLGTDHEATFTNLDGGEYLLRVKGSNNDGVWNEEGASLRLTVTPPWWKTRWAYGSYALLVLGFFYTVRRFEINRREQKMKVRESELRAKAVEAEKRALEAENERQTKELEDARNLQLSMLPKDVPRLPDYDIAVFMKTATEVGGDYYDFNVAQDGTFNVAFGDATGHGMQAGTIVTLMKGLFVSDAARFDIQTFFNHCSRAIKEIRLARLFMAFTLVRLKGNSLSFSSAGMPPVYLYRKNGGTVEEILLKGMPLGAMKNFPYALHETELQRGDTVLLLTDGLPEQKNAAGEMFDYAKVQSMLAEIGAGTPDDIIAQLIKAGESWMDSAVQDDDITLLVIKMRE